MAVAFTAQDEANLGALADQLVSSLQAQGAKVVSMSIQVTAQTEVVTTQAVTMAANRP